MPRGGGGRGQGRKPILAAKVDRLRVGARIEELWKETVEEAKAKALQDFTKEARNQWAKAEAIPVEDRAAWTKTQAFQEYLDDVRGALQEDQGIDLVDDDRDPALWLRIGYKKPWGVRNKIVKQVADEFGIAETTALWYLKEFRKFRKLQRAV
jgi:hypothetical protein